MTAVAAVSRKPRLRLFFVTASLIAAALVYWGFSATYFHRPAELGQLSGILRWHGALFTAWIAIFLMQSTLIAAHQRTAHMRLGIAAMGVAVLMVVFGSLAALDALHRGAIPVPGIDPRSFFAIPVRSMVIFPALVVAGFYFRRHADTHKRLMLLATISILDAAIARIPIAFIANGGPIAFYGLQDLLVVICAVIDWRNRGRLHPAFLWGGLLIIVSGPLTLMISATPMWASFADWCLAAYR